MKHVRALLNVFLLQLEGLESLFVKRAAQIGLKKGNFVNSAHNYHHTWFRKRLVEEKGSVFQTDDEVGVCSIYV